MNPGTREPAAPAVERRQPLRVLIADDSFLIREGLRQVLALAPQVQVAGTYADPAALLEAVDAQPPDVVLTDIRMPPTQTDEGMRVAERLRQSHPAVGVVVLSQHGSAHYAARLLASGASGRGYLLKDRIHDLEHLVSTIEDVAAGGCRIDTQLVDSLMASRRPRDRTPLDALTPRQTEIIAALAAGQSNLAMAQAFGLTQRAIEKHVSEIFARLGIANDDAISRRVHAALLYLTESQA